MRVTVAICTWNRAAVLHGVLDSLASSRSPDEVDWSVLVVDNGSTDDTADVVASFRRSLALSYVLEERPGLSAARNRALREVKEGVVLWLDDDVVVVPQWLSAYVQALRRWPEDTVFGGPIEPRLEGAPPAWLLRCSHRVDFAFGAHDLGSEPIALGPSIDRFPFGGNFGLRVGGLGNRRFREELGRRQDGPGRGGEEIALIRDIFQAGGSGRWVPGARVKHRIGPERQTAAYIRARCVADAMDDELEESGGRGGRTSVGVLITHWLWWELRYRFLRVIRGSDAWVDALLKSGDAWGRVSARVRRTGGRAP